MGEVMFPSYDGALRTGRGEPWGGQASRLRGHPPIAGPGPRCSAAEYYAVIYPKGDPSEICPLRFIRSRFIRSRFIPGDLSLASTNLCWIDSRSGSPPWAELNRHLPIALRP